MSACTVNPATIQPSDLTVASVATRMAPYQARLDEVLRRYPVKRGALLQVLWLVQEEFGWVPRVAIEWAAQVSAVSPVHAFGVVEFYTMYRQVPTGRHLIQVCQTMCCLLQGSEPLIAHLEHTLGIHAGETTADGVFTLVRAECLALCGTGPAVMIDDQAIGAEPHALGGRGRLAEHHLDTADFHPTPAVLDRWIAFLRTETAKAPAAGTSAQQTHASLGDLVLGTKGHPGGFGASAQPVAVGYCPPAPALKLVAKVDGTAVTLTWLNDPAAVKLAVERSDDAGATWREIAAIGPKDQKAADQVAVGATAQYRVTAHEKDRVARPSAVVSATGATPAAPAAAPAAPKA